MTAISRRKEGTSEGEIPVQNELEAAKCRLCSIPAGVRCAMRRGRRSPWQASGSRLSVEVLLWVPGSQERTVNEERARHFASPGAAVGLRMPPQPRLHE